MLQIIHSFVDLFELVAMGNQFIELQLTLAVPANEDRKVAVGFAIAAAGARK